MAVSFIRGESSDAEAKSPRQVPLVVDLDNTLIATDLLFESLARLLRDRPLAGFLVPFWLMRGIAWLKHELASRVALDVDTLPYRFDLIEYLKSEKKRGRAVALATGADEQFAQKVADHLGIFDFTFASDGQVNLCGKAKRDLLIRHFGDKGFDYIGDGQGFSNKEAAVESASRLSGQIGPETGLRARALLAVRALRPSHWLKNVLVFVPLAIAKRWEDPHLLLNVMLAFLALSFCASAGYLLNDLFDLDADRRHPTKKSRPFASGALPLIYALVLVPLALAGGLLLACLALPAFGLMAAFYFSMSALYSVRLKSVALIDVLFLSGLYTMRIMAGSVVTGLWSSHWILGSAALLFFSLAL
ncbi:MAG: UbiA family prenyltransferase, partial [Acidobacteriota bacterium]|nr:UbiA family prenyltransferase [Acidobacteriota bacterium]